MNKLLKINLIGKLKFGDIPINSLMNHFKDVNNISNIIGLYIPILYPKINHIGNNNHTCDNGNQYIVKYFTKNGLTFAPSNPSGTRRLCNIELSHKLANKLTYICCDITNFPIITLKIIKGSELVNKYPRCVIPYKDKKWIFTK